MRAPILAVTCALGAVPAAAAHSGHPPAFVDVAQFAYTPAEATVFQGDSVVFRWSGGDSGV